MNADTDQEITTLTNGLQVDLSTVGTNNLTIKAETDPSITGSVVLDLTGAKIVSRTENIAPYVLFGDSNNGQRDLFGSSFGNGSYTITGTAYEGANATGANSSSTVQFSIIGSPTALTVFPNTAPKGLEVTVAGNTGNLVETGMITVYDMMGRAILTTQVEPGEFSKTLTLEDAQEGVYIIDLNNKEKKRLLVTE